MSTAPKYRPHYTVADYQLWEGDWELWYGTAVSMSPSPFGPHERAVSKIVAQLDTSISTSNCACAVYAGLDWIVQNDTVVRPDVMLVCGEQPERHLERPPALVVEVLSPSSAEKDLTAKRQLYEQQQVEHYLLIDVAKQTISWLALRNGSYVEMPEQSPQQTLQIALANGCVVMLSGTVTFSIAGQ